MAKPHFKINSVDVKKSLSSRPQHDITKLPKWAQKIIADEKRINRTLSLNSFDADEEIRILEEALRKIQQLCLDSSGPTREAKLTRVAAWEQIHDIPYEAFKEIKAYYEECKKVFPAGNA